MAEELVKKEEFKTGAVKLIDIYVPMINNSFKNLGVSLTDYQLQCATWAVGEIKEIIDKNSSLVDGIQQINQNSISKAVTDAAKLGLDIRANPRQCYVQLRKSNKSYKVKKNDGTEEERAMYDVEFNVEGAGYDILLKNYGVDVKSFHSFVIREGDDFTLPYFDGEKMCLPTWRPKSLDNTRKILAVVYIVTKTDGTKECLMAERDSLKFNLAAHIKQNVEYSSKDIKDIVMKKLEELSFDEMLKDEYLTTSHSYKWRNDNKTCNPISPAWLSLHSQNAMIERKLRNNAIKKYPKQFGKSYIDDVLSNEFSEKQEELEIDLTKNQNSEIVDTQLIPTAEETPTVDDNGVVQENVITNANEDAWIEE